jgi:transposase
MSASNKYACRSKISETKFRQLVKLFAIDLDASQIAAVTGLNRNTVNRYLMAIRQRIAQVCQRESPVAGEIEIDESYFGPRRG